MAFAAVVSLNRTIQLLLYSSPISIQNAIRPYEEIIELAQQATQSLEELLSTWEYSMMKAVEKDIREAACRLEDVLESFLASHQHFVTQSQSPDGDQKSYLEKLKEETQFFIQTVKKIEEQLRGSVPVSEEDDTVVSSTADPFCEKTTKFFGLSSDLIKLKDLLTGHSAQHDGIVSIVGMAGIGKTTLAKAVYVDPLILNHFECRAFVSIGPKYKLVDVVLRILAQINPRMDETYAESEGELVSHLYKCLTGRRYLIVLDDVWGGSVKDQLTERLPYEENGSRIIVTTRMDDIALSFTWSCNIHHMQFLNEDESWQLLREKVFGEEHSCPFELQEAGKKIAMMCQGLPLAIVSVSNHLSSSDRTPEYWNKVGEKEISAIIDADEELLKVICLSYEHLRIHVKACFLYLGVFPLDYEIPISKLLELWCAEGFLQADHRTLQRHAKDCLEELVSNGVVLVQQKGSLNGIKTCRVHLVFRQLCIRSAGKEKFFHIVDSNTNQGIESQRRLCINNNALFGIKDVYKSMASITNVRSILCIGPYHQFPVPICLDFNLLRVLDALTIRFFVFPVEVVKLIRLRYLSFTYNGKLPASISRLQNLQCLIVHQCLRVISSGTHLSYLPIEIWTMEALRHLHVMGSDLPHPNSDYAFLPNLVTLSGISGRSCMPQVIERLPKLKKLGIQIELSPDANEPLYYSDHDSYLFGQLVSLKYVVMNPNTALQVVFPERPIPILPLKLEKLNLSGLGLPWKCMSIIAQLRELKVLKLRCYAFRGQNWKIYGGQFQELEFLLLEDTDLEDWEISDHCFLRLKCLSIRHCYKLKKLPWNLKVTGLKMIKIDDCDPALVDSANEIAKERERMGIDGLQLCIDSSDDKGKLQPQSTRRLRKLLRFQV